MQPTIVRPTSSPIEATNTPLLTYTPSPTQTPTPSTTPMPTATETPTPTPIPTKQVLIQYGIFGGDGGYNTDFYLGRDTPDLVIYTDGQLLIRNFSDEGSGDWFMETTLTISQICSLLSRIEQTGFFSIQGNGTYEEYDPIYQFDDSVMYSGGAPDYVIQINGERHKYVTIYRPYEPYLIPEVRATLEIIRNIIRDYSSTELTVYKAKYLLLWIEKGKGRAAYVTPVPTPQIWPVEFPPLETLLRNENETQVFVEGDYVEPILSLFGDRFTDKLFKAEGQTYYVIARPLLPHETPQQFSVYPYEDLEFKLPFGCNN